MCKQEETPGADPGLGREIMFLGWLESIPLKELEAVAGERDLGISLSPPSATSFWVSSRK